MRRTFSQIVASLLIIALVAPAASAAAGQQAGQRPPSAKSVSINAAINRAIAESQATGQAPVGQVKARGIRMQGAGKSGMIMGLASAVIGIVGMMYMMKYLKDQQKATETTSVRVR